MSYTINVIKIINNEFDKLIESLVNLFYLVIKLVNILTTTFHLISIVNC